MKIVSMKKEVVKEVIHGQTYYFPVFILDGKQSKISHQGQVVKFTKEEDAKEYHED